MRRMSLLLLTVITVLAGGSVHAASPQITDPEGDANGLLYSAGPDTRPVSYDPADLVSVRLQTAYRTIRVGDDGLRHEPTALQIRFTTLAPPQAPGTSLGFLLHAGTGSQTSLIKGFLGGDVPDPRAGDVEWTLVTERAYVLGTGEVTKDRAWFGTAVPGGSDFVITIPFASLTPAQLRLIGPGATLRDPSARTFTSAATYVLGPLGVWTPHANLDVTMAGSSYVVGSDVPADRPCTRGCS